MDIKEVKSKKLYKEYSLSIPFDDIDKEINKKILNLIPTLSIPGFRKGKAPISIVRKKYEDNILNEVLQTVISTNTSNLIKNKKLDLFREPKINLKNFEKNKPVNIEIKIDLQPQIDLVDYKKINYTKYKIKFSKKHLDEQYENFLKSQKNFKLIKNTRKIKKTDRVTVNFETTSKDIPEYLSSQKNIPIDTDVDQEIIPGINKKLISEKLKQGDKRKISFDLSKLLKNEKFKNVVYLFEIISIEEKTKFEITKEYLKKNGFENEKQIKEIMEKNITDQYNKSIKQIEKKQLMDLLEKKHNFDLPEGVLEDDFKEIWKRLELAKKDGALDKDDKNLTVNALKKRYKKISQRRVKLGALLQFISKKEKINLSEEDLSKGILQYTSQYPGQEKQIIEYLKKTPSALESIRGPLLEQKIIDLITSKANLINKIIDENQYKKLEEDTFNIKKENNNE